jgi:prolyl-tRNA editing enzyme YbaK/EbsC (Cys-tRNA(Pro) deacylase)
MTKQNPILGPVDLQQYMRQHGIPGEIIHLDQPTPTVEDAASAVHTQTDRIIKSVLFTIYEEHVLTITCGVERVERRVIAALYGVGRKRVKLTPAETVLEVTGYPVGTVPPFGHRQPLRTLLDPGVLEHNQVYAGGGAGNALVRLDPQDILRITQAEVMDLHTPPS